MRRDRSKFRWTTTAGKGKFIRTNKRSVLSNMSPLPCEELSDDVWTLAGVKCGCPFLGPYRTDIRNLLEPNREKKGTDSLAKKIKTSGKNRSRNQGQEICPEDYLKLDIDVSGYLCLQIVDCSFLAEVNTCKSDKTREPSKAPLQALLPCEGHTVDGSNGLVPYSDDDDDHDEGDEMYREDVRNETLSLPSLKECKWSQRSHGDDDQGFHDDFCTCKQCRERDITSEHIDHQFEIEAPEKANSRKSNFNELSTRSEADSAYWSLGSNRSTVFDTPRISNTSTIYSGTAKGVGSGVATEDKNMTTRELLDTMFPPLPKEPCPSKLQAKFDKLFALKEKGLNLTELIKKNHNYQNPCLLENHWEDYSTRNLSFSQSGTHCDRPGDLQMKCSGTYIPLD